MQTPSEYPILFNGPMVRAILDGCKTQTRRPVKPQFSYLFGHGSRKHMKHDDYACHVEMSDGSVRDITSPYGGRGDLLYVRENFHLEQRYDDISPKDMLRIAEQDGRGILYQTAAGDQRHEYSTVPRDDNDGWAPGKTRPSIHMPKGLSRLWLEVKDVRVERVRGIGYFDCLREGVFGDEGTNRYCAPGINGSHFTPFSAFRALWDTMHDEDGLCFRDNPWVWVYTFERIDPADIGA